MPDLSIGKAMEIAEIQMAADIAGIQEPRNLNMADYACEVIMEHIREFEEHLDNDHETAIKLASFGQSVTIAVTEISYSNPSVLVFTGYVGTQPATLIQHISQLNFLLLAVPKADPEKPARRVKIGFHDRSEN